MPLNADTVYKRGGATGFAPYMLPPPLLIDDLMIPPPPVGYTPRIGMPHLVPTIMQVLQTNRLYPDARSRTSGYAEPGYSGTSTPANSWW
jgi:hypothetical protein